MSFHLIPTAWQRVIYRNYGTVKTANLAKVLGTDEATVVLHAEKLGLSKIEYDENWAKKGFVTVIRNNWDILPNNGICTLLELDGAAFEALLVEYDFLDVKLGEKPNVEAPVYAPLSEDEERATLAVKEFTEANVLPVTTKPFDFFKNGNNTAYLPPKQFAIAQRYTSCYCSSYSGALLDDELSDYSEEYLARLSSIGMNGIWIQDTLRNLAAFPFDESLSPDYQIRVKNLKKLTERCEKFGISVYLYLNEPRSLPAAFFEKYPQLRGQKTEDGKGYCLCTSVPTVREYLYGAIKSLAEGAPRLKGIMTITMSENHTHCYSRPWADERTGLPATDCPHCKNRSAEEVAAEVNNVIARALRDGNGYTKLIANLWSWSDFMHWSDEMVEKGVRLLDKEIEVLCVSEFSKPFERGGVKAKVIDYSISEVGPSPITEKTLALARQLGHKIWAKIQVNNSWECSAAPYIPAYDLMLEHIDNLKKLGVEGLMMGWSLGGYPGGALTLCNMACGAGEVCEREWYEATYGENAELAKRAVGVFSKAFKEYPFSVDVLYFGGHTLGVGNFWSLTEEKRASTMVCYTFDDYEAYTKPYGVDVYISQYKKLTEQWKEGLALLEEKTGNENYAELIRVAQCCYAQFESARLHAEFSKAKRTGGGTPSAKERMLRCVEEELALTKLIYHLVSEDSKIGFEMTNHYYYNANQLLEKMLNLLSLKRQLNG